MGFKEAVNAALVKATGYQLQRPGAQRAARKRPAEVERLLEHPAFILSSVRSGSTLLRVILNSHSQIHSPPEMHLRDISVQVKKGPIDKTLGEIGLDEQSLSFLLWDRVLDREVRGAGKRLLVNKTPNDAFIADDIAACWPDARFIYLLRHPAAIARSRQAARPQDAPENNARMVLRYGTAVEEARRKHGGLTVRYEELTANPEAETRRVCEFLGVKWEPQMLDYGRFDHGPFKAGLGDWSKNIRSGEIRAAEPPPEALPPELEGLARDWGYLDADATQPVATPPR